MTTTSSDTPVSTPVQASENTQVGVLPTNAVSLSASTTVPGEGYSMHVSSGQTELGDVLLRDQLIRRITISSADTDTRLVNYSVWTDYLASPLITSRLKGIQFIRGDIELTATLTCPGSSVGAYILSFVCEGGQSSTTEFDNSACDVSFTSTQHEHFILNCESQSGGQITLPYVFPLTTMKKTSTSLVNPIWRLTAYALSPLVSTITSSPITGTINVYARLKPGYVVETLFYESSKPSQVTGALAGFSNVLSKAPLIGPFAAVASSGLAAASSVLDMLGYTREASPRMPEPTQLRYASNFANVDGTDASTVLGLSAGNTVTIDPHVAGGSDEDCMAFSSLFQRWSIIRTINITMTTPVGKIADISVTPSGIISYSDALFGLGMNITVPGYVGLPFNYWSGGVEYRIYIPSSSNIQGRLQVFWTPSSTLPTLINDPTIYMEGTMIDLSGSSDTYLHIGMAPPNPVRQNYPILCTDGQDLTGNSTNGKLVFYLTSQLTAPRSSFTLPIIVMSRGSPTTQFHQPRNVMDLRSLNSTISYAYQSKKMDDATIIPQYVRFCETAGQPIEEIHFGETVESTRALVQKFSPYCVAMLSTAVRTDYNPFTDGAPTLALPFPPLAPTAGADPQRYCTPEFGADTNTMWVDDGFKGLRQPLWTWQSHYGMLFVGVRGSTRVKVTPYIELSPATNRDPIYAGTYSVVEMANVETAYQQFIVASMPLNAMQGLIPPQTHYDMPIVESLAAGEVTVPYYSPWRFTNPRRRNVSWNAYSITNTSGTSSSGVVLQKQCTNDTPGDFPLPDYFPVHIAGGPDFSGNRFRRTPKVFFRPYSLPG